jgi:hypothetical protein
MPQLINYGKETLMVSQKSGEYSTYGERSWNIRYTGFSCDDFNSLAESESERMTNISKECIILPTSEEYGTKEEQESMIVTTKTDDLSSLCNNSAQAFCIFATSKRNCHV